MASGARPYVKLTPTAFDLIAMGVVVVAVLYGGISLGVGYADLPDRIPTHFNGKGEPDTFGSPSTLWVIFAIQLASAVGLWVLALIPQKHNYMVEITEENAKRVYGTSVSMLHAVNAIISVYLSYLLITSMSIGAGLAEGLGNSSILIFTVCLTGFSGFFIWRSFRVR